MLRRTGFKRPQIKRKPVVHVPLDPKFRRPVTMATDLAVEPVVTIEKTEREENPHYRAMARDKDCMLLVPGTCTFDRSTVVLAHSNWHDKGAARKASDYWGVWACYGCHSWLDQGKALEAQKKAAFAQGLKRMAVELEKIAADPMQKARDREAATWALDRLKQQPAP